MGFVESTGELVHLQHLVVPSPGHAVCGRHDFCIAKQVRDTFQVAVINALGVGGGYGWDRNFTLDLTVSGGGRISVRPFVPGTPRVSGQSLTTNYSSLTCQSSCQHSLQEGLRLVLVAEADSGETFQGWEGTSCSAPGCALTPLTSNRSLRATFSGDGSAQLPAPDNLRASNGTYPDRVQLTWDGVDGAYKYRIERAGSMAGSYQFIGQLRSTTFNDRSVSGSTRYYYRVQACATNTGECGSYSAAVAGSASGTGSLSPPAGVQASQGTYPDRVRLTWQPVEGAYKYRVSRHHIVSG